MTFHLEVHISRNYIPCEKKMCIEMKTMVTPMQKLMVRACPNRAADMSPVKMVAIVEEYFFSMVSAYLKKKEDRMPCKALLTTKSMVTCRYAQDVTPCILFSQHNEAFQTSFTH